MTRVHEARALRRDAAFDLAPSINAGGGYTKTRTSHAGTAARRSREIGALRRGLRRVLGTRLLRRRAPRARSQQRRARRRGSRRCSDVQVIVTAEVTRTYFELRGQQQQLDVARRNVANQQSTLDLAQVRLDAGSGTEFDTARAQAQLSATLGTIGPLEAAVARSIHRLSRAGGPRARRAARRARAAAEPAAAAGHRARGRPGRPAAPPAGYPHRRA